MILKYVIADLSGIQVGLRFRPTSINRGFAEICGYGRHYDLMERLVREFGHRKVPNPKWFKANKCSYSWRLGREEFSGMVEAIRESGLLVEQVDKLGDLVR